ncbi:MAG: hypothetical protein KAV00_07095 [Phycisphaerae bacterium]|nr:hypothetical protein [Phycisphaerae bacterium]
MAKSKRVVIISDMHAGHRAGLTPPAWQLKPGEDEEIQHRRIKWVDLQRECWGWFYKGIKRLKPIDVLIVNGDAIDGTGYRSGGVELITTDRNVQIDMALKVIRTVGAKKVFMIRGTDYHVGSAENQEDLIAALVPCKIGNHEWIDINGVILDCKHHIGGSSIPHGRATALLRDDLWNSLWHEADEQPRADILIRSHVHFHIAVSRIVAGRPKLALITPALQAQGTRYGARRMSGHVDFGFISLDITPQGEYQWRAHIAVLQAQKARVSKI